MSEHSPDATTSSLRILMISDVYFPRINGVSTSIQTFTRSLTKLGHRVTLIAPDYGVETEQGIDILRIPSRYVFVDPEDRMMKSSAIRRQVQDLRAADYDVIHIHTPFVAHYMGLHLARRLRLPVVETYHTFFQEYLYNYIPWLPRGGLRFAARHFSRAQCNAVDAVIAPSSAMAGALRGYGVKRRVEVIPTGIRLQDFSLGDGAAMRQKLGLAPDRPVLVHIGRIAHEKNVDFLIESLARIRQSVEDVVLLIAGDGPAMGHVKRRVASLGLDDHVIFLGYLARDGELQSCFRAGDAFIFSSVTETQGLVLLEAMACGVPVVALAEMGTRDVLAEGAGALVAENDVADLAAATVRLLQDPNLRRELSERAEDYVRHWSDQVQAEKLAALYRELMRQYEVA